jgi:hypothetical protein
VDSGEDKYCCREWKIPIYRQCGNQFQSALLSRRSAPVTSAQSVLAVSALFSTEDEGFPCLRNLTARVSEFILKWI